MSLHTSARWLTPSSSNSLLAIVPLPFRRTLSEIGPDHELELGFRLVRGITLDQALRARVLHQQVFRAQAKPVAWEPGYRCVKGVAVFVEGCWAGRGVGVGLVVFFFCC